MPNKATRNIKFSSIRQAYNRSKKLGRIWRWKEKRGTRPTDTN